MAHVVDHERHGAPWILKALTGAVQATKGVFRRSAEEPAEGKPRQAHDAFPPEVVEHLREIVENGYIEEESGKRVHVPPYIRAQLVSELRLLD